MKRKKPLFECVGRNQFRIIRESNDDMDAESEMRADDTGPWGEWIDSFLEFVGPHFDAWKRGDKNSGLYSAIYEWFDKNSVREDWWHDLEEALSEDPRTKEIMEYWWNANKGGSGKENFGTWGGLG